MRRKNLPDLDARVQAFVHDWEELVTQQLQATKVKLLWCSGQERAKLKTHLETLAGVADLLQGRRSKETCDQELSEEIYSLRAKLGKSEANVKLLLAAFQAQKKLNKDLKVQLRRQFKVSLTAEKKNQELRQQLKNQENRVSPFRPSPQTPADLELQSLEQEAPQLLRVEEPQVELWDKKDRKRRKKERPANEHKMVARSMEEKRAESRFVASENTVWPVGVTSERWAEPVGVASENRVESGDMAVESRPVVFKKGAGHGGVVPEKRTENGSVTSEKRAESGDVVSENRAESGRVATEKRLESGGVAPERKAEPGGVAADLKAVLMKVCQQLNVQHQSLKEILDQRDQRWEEKFLELRNRMEKLETKKKRRRNWF